MSATRPAPPSPQRLVLASFPAPSIRRQQRAIVVLPPGYDSGRSRYAVLELLHGRPGQPEDYLSATDLLGALASPTAPPLIAVLPDGHGPVVADGDFADTSRQRLGAAMSDDLQAWVNATFRTNGRWTVGGLSAGGYGAAYLGARRPHQYQAVCAMGGYFDARPPAFAGESTAVRALASPLRHVSPDGPATLVLSARGDAEYAADSDRYYAALRRGGQAAARYVLSGGHDWGVWRSALALCLPFAATGDVPAVAPSPSSSPSTTRAHGPR
jgi:enterochelin esterase-like enzyme